MGGVAVGETTLELTRLDGEFLPTRPLDGGIPKGHTAVHLHLYPILEVIEQASGHIHSEQTDAKAVSAMVSALVVITILSVDIASELRGRSP